MGDDAEEAEPIAAAELFRRDARFVARFLVRYGLPPA
jgi:hypothetical protein